MRRVLIPLIVLLVFGLALQAQAHNFTGDGDCDGWTLQLDGTWGATEIYVDGISVGLAQTINIPDTSTAEMRTFEVRWDKPQTADVIVDHTLERELDGCTPDEETTTTTILEDTTTTSTVPVTTTSPTTTVPSPTTTTVPATSTTAPTRLTDFGAFGECIEEGLARITMVFDEGISRIDLLYTDPLGDVLLYTFLPEDGPVVTKLSDVAATFEVRGYAADGYEFEAANQPDDSHSKFVTVTDCEEEATVTTVQDAVTSTVINTVETLPFTGPEDNAALVVLGLGLLGLGVTLVRGFKVER